MVRQQLCLQWTYLFCTALQWTGLDWTALHRTALQWTALHVTALKCTVHSIIKDSLAGENAFQIFERSNCMESICFRDSCILLNKTCYKFWNFENLLMAFIVCFIERKKVLIDRYN